MYTHSNREGGIALGALRRARLSQVEIGRELGFNRSSIGRERKCSPKPRGAYHVLNADIQAKKRRKKSMYVIYSIPCEHLITDKGVSSLKPK